MLTGAQLVVSAIWSQLETALFSLLKATSELATELAFSPQRTRLFGEAWCSLLEVWYWGVGQDLSPVAQNRWIVFCSHGWQDKSQEEAVPCFLSVLKPQTSFFGYSTNILHVFLNTCMSCIITKKTVLGNLILSIFLSPVGHVGMI